MTVASPSDALPAHAAALDAVMVRRCDGAPGWEDLLAADPRRNALVLGPAAGVGDETRERVAAALAAGRHAVLDADALTSFGGDAAALAALVAGRGGGAERGVVLTPHDGEFASLFRGMPEVLRPASKLERTRAAASAMGAVVVLKGADTVIAAPDGRAAVNANGTPWLATAGSGDVLAGVIGGLLAQSVPAYEAAAAAVWMHAAAGSALGPGLIAEDLPDALRARAPRPALADRPSGSRYLEPAGQAGIEALQHRRADQPAALVVGDEGDPLGLVLQQDHRVQPVGFPAVVEGVEQAKAVAMDVDGLWKGCAVRHGEHDRRAALHREDRLAEPVARTPGRTPRSRSRCAADPRSRRGWIRLPGVARPR